MTDTPLNIVILGLSITSSWGNGHATTFRALARELQALGHHVTFLERDVPWYASHRDLPEPPFCKTHLYGGLDELRERFGGTLQHADAVIVGSFVPQGVEVGEWALETACGVVAFYDIDTPVTLAKLRRRDFEYLTPDLVRKYPLYLSFSGGKTIQTLEGEFGSPRARPLYCSVDPDLYLPQKGQPPSWDLGYMGTYSEDRQPPLDLLLLQAARSWPEGRFVVAGPQYPADISWPANVERVEHLPPARHRSFYNSQRFTLNITRSDMIAMGHSPSVRLFEAAACGVPVISDWWEGLDELFTPGEEILISHSPAETLHFLKNIPPEEANRIGTRARQKTLNSHTARHRARELVNHLQECAAGTRQPASPATETTKSN
jgi:spore maturation protein CgeB